MKGELKQVLFFGIGSVFGLSIGLFLSQYRSLLSSINFKGEDDEEQKLPVWIQNYFEEKQKTGNKYVPVLLREWYVQFNTGV